MTGIFQASYDDGAEILLVRSIGGASHDRHVELLEQAVRLCEQRGWSRLLFDLRFAGIVAANRGRPVREFEDLDAARCWLLAH